MPETNALDGAAEGVSFMVAGRVQHVAFRWFVSRAAAELGVKGWVRNRMDGRVEGEAFGAAPRLERFLDRLRQGPPAARVERLDWEVIPDPGALQSFEIRR